MNFEGMAYRLNKRRLKKIINRVQNLPRGAGLFKYSLNKVHGLALKATKSTKVPFPSSIMLEVTNHCNLGCISDAMAKGTIKLDQLKKVIDEVTPYVGSIGLTGLGETLLYKQLEETLRYIKSKNKGIQTFISTNAHIPGAETYIARLAPYLNTVQISIDGVGATYEAVRLKSDFNFFSETARKLIAECKKQGVAVMFNFVAVKENYTQMKDVVQMAIDVGVEDLNITPVNLAAITAWDISYYEIFYSDSFKEELRKAKELADQHEQLRFTMWDVKTPNDFKKCHLPWNHFYISWDGYMTPCCAKPFPKELNFGNVFETSLMACLNSDGYRKFREMWYRNETPDFCSKCHVVDLKPLDLDMDMTYN